MRAVLGLMMWIFATGTMAEPVTTSLGQMQITPVVTGLDEPWGFGFLPDGSVLITEKAGRLTHVTLNAQPVSVKGLPKIKADGQGGLLDIMIPRDFATSRQVFLSHSVRQGRGAGTALSVGELSGDGSQLNKVQTIFEMREGSRGGKHFGSRIVEAGDGTIFLTIGERGDRPAAQDLGTHNGTVVRINRDGSIPGDNPFVGQEGALPEIWSYGHRNPQGAALDLQGQLWINEHGARGGDEVNRVRKGANYGWPVIAYGRHYTGGKIGEGTAKAGMEQPDHFWDPSIAPSGMMIYSGKLWPKWKGHIFIGSLKFDYLSRLNSNNWQEERIENADTGRVRDVREAPDGTIWFLSVNEGALMRMGPG